MKTLVALVALTALLALAPSAGAATLVGITADNKLFTFDSAAPGTVSAATPITGVSGQIRGLDARPNGAALYVMTLDETLYTLDPATAVATPVGPPFTTALNGTAFGFDFNPVPDRVRVTSNNEQNLRLNPFTGAIAAVDSPLAYAVGDPNEGDPPFVAAAGYTNSFAGATTTTLYGIDLAQDVLLTQDPPNAGVLNTVGSLGGSPVGAEASLDIDPLTGVAYAVLNQPAGTERLYTVNLATGAATEVGALGVDAGTTVTNVAVLPTEHVRLAAAEAGATEGGVATVSVTRSDASPSGAASVEWQTAPGSATTDDYTHSSGTLTWPAGDTSAKTIEVPVANDGASEGVEEFTIGLTKPTGAWLGTPHTATVKLGDSAPATATGGPGGGQQPTTPPDTTAPLATLRAARKVRIGTVARRGLALTATCDEECITTTTLTVTRKVARRLKLPRTLALRERVLPAGQRAKIALKPRRSTAKRLRRVKRAFKATISVKLGDAAGNTRTVKRTVTLRP